MNPYRLPSPPSRPPELKQRLDWVALFWATFLSVTLLFSMLPMLLLVLFDWYGNIHWPSEFRALLSPREIYREVADERFRRNTVQGPL